MQNGISPLQECTSTSESMHQGIQGIQGMESLNKTRLAPRTSGECRILLGAESEIHQILQLCGKYTPARPAVKVIQLEELSGTNFQKDFPTFRCSLKRSRSCLHVSFVHRGKIRRTYKKSLLGEDSSRSLKRSPTVASCRTVASTLMPWAGKAWHTAFHFRTMHCPW